MGQKTIKGPISSSRRISYSVGIRFGGIHEGVAFSENEVKPRVAWFSFSRRYRPCHRKSRCPVPVAHVSGEMLRPCGSRQVSRRSRRRRGPGSVRGIGRASKLVSISLRLPHLRGSRLCWIARGKPSLKGAIDPAGLLPLKVGQTFIWPTPFSRTHPN